MTERYVLQTTLSGYPHYWNVNYWTTFKRLASAFDTRQEADAELQRQMENGGSPVTIEEIEDDGDKPLSLWFELKLVETDTSQLEYDAKHGTTLNKSLPKEYEYRVYEVGHNYRALSGQFPATKRGYASAIELMQEAVTL